VLLFGKFRFNPGEQIAMKSKPGPAPAASFLPAQYYTKKHRRKTDIWNISELLF